MGKGFENYMSKKWFHPTNIDNLKRKYAAEQKSAADLKRQQDLRDQYEREQEVFSNKQLMGDEKARLGLSFIYNAPGSLKDQQNDNNQKGSDSKQEWPKNDDNVKEQHEAKNVRCLKCKRWGHANTDKICPLYGKSRLDCDVANDDEAYSKEADELIEKHEQRQKIKEENSTKEKSDEKDDKGYGLVTLDLLKKFSKKEKKTLLKRLVSLERKLKK